MMMMMMNKKLISMLMLMLLLALFQILVSASSVEVVDETVTPGSYVYHKIPSPQEGNILELRVEATCVGNIGQRPHNDCNFYLMDKANFDKFKSGFSSKTLEKSLSSYRFKFSRDDLKEAKGGYYVMVVENVSQYDDVADVNMSIEATEIEEEDDDGYDGDIGDLCSIVPWLCK